MRPKLYRAVRGFGERETASWRIPEMPGQRLSFLTFAIGGVQARSVAPMAKQRDDKAANKSGRQSEQGTRVLPMELQIGDRLTDETGEWEVIGHPYTTECRDEEYDVGKRPERQEPARVSVPASSCPGARPRTSERALRRMRSGCPVAAGSNSDRPALRERAELGRQSGLRLGSLPTPDRPCLVARYCRHTP